MDKKRVTEIVKTCGLSIIPEVDLTNSGCNHFHNTECIIENNELEYLNVVNVSQKEVNKRIDENLKTLDFELKQIEDIKDKNIVSYDTYKLHTTLLTRLLNNGTTIIEGSQNIVVKYLEIKSTNSFSEPLVISTELVLKAYNKNNELVYSTDVSKIDKIKKVNIFKTIDIPNQWDDVVKVNIEPKFGLSVSNELNLEIKLYYNLE